MLQSPQRRSVERRASRGSVLMAVHLARLLAWASGLRLLALGWIWAWILGGFGLILVGFQLRLGLDLVGFQLWLDLA